MTFTLTLKRSEVSGHAGAIQCHVCSHRHLEHCGEASTNRILLWRCDSQIRRLTLRDDFVEPHQCDGEGAATGDRGRHLPGTEVGQRAGSTPMRSSSNMTQPPFPPRARTRTRSLGEEHGPRAPSTPIWGHILATVESVGLPRADPQPFRLL